ncbi:MAG: 2-hydroxyacid dehydrogenase [Phycisphaeraceae bacterium]
MKIAVVSTKPYDRQFLSAANHSSGHELVFLEPRLTEATASMVAGFAGVCAFVNDVLNRAVLTKLKAGGTKVIALRCAGFNNVDLDAAAELGLRIVRVPAYSPFGVAEHTVALMLTLNRQIHRAFNRVREGNFSLDGLLGFEMRGLTIGVVGTGKIGAIVARILRGFDCDILAFDIRPEPSVLALGGRYVEMDELLGQSDIITLHCPLTPQTHHLINGDAVKKMKAGAMLINTGRGALVQTPAVIHGLKSGKIGSLGLDVYEEEADLFFENLSDKIIQDDIFTRLLTFPNVIVTAHQAFFTRHALEAIAQVTIGNLSEVERGEACANEVNTERKGR